MSFLSLLSLLAPPLASTMLVGVGLGLLVIVFASAFAWAILELQKARKKQHRRESTVRSLRERVSQLEAERMALEGQMLELESNTNETARNANKTLEKAKEAQEMAEQASRAKGTFLATMSHEIRTPLNCIRGLSEVLMATDPNDEQRNYLETIRRSVDALLAIVGNILDFSKIEAGRLELRPERFNLNELIEEVGALFEIDAKRRNLEFSATMDPPTPFQIVADRSHLRQVLINLIGNGLKYTEKGYVKLTCSRGRIIDENIPANKTYYQVTFSIADTGIGIPDEKKGLLFKPFNQLVESKTRKYEGTGLGLAICHKIITEGMRGEVQVRDNPEGGSIFEALIPVEGFSVVKSGSEKKLTNPSLIKHALGTTFYSHKILVADDNHLNCEVMRAMLRKMGHEAEFVYNGRDAVEYLAKSTDINVVLMDIMMPLMDGVEATQRIRAGDAGPAMKDIPIIALTAFAMVSDREEFLSKGFNFYLTKPIEPDLLRDTLTNLARSKSHTQAGLPA